MPHSRSFDITSSDANPSTATTLSREKCPRATRNRDLATPSVSASSSSSAALAFPSWGGALTSPAASRPASPAPGRATPGAVPGR